MADLSLREYLQKKSAGQGQGVRWCAPGLSKISLRKLLLGINRRIIHLSDLHIGLNNDTTNEIQVKQIIDAIKRTYPQQYDSYESPRPIIVITGDIVDYGDSTSSQVPQNHLDTAYDLLDDLTQAGFTVLLIPGNHDYSDSFNTNCFTPLEACNFDIGPLLGSPIPMPFGTMIMVAANVANIYIGKGQDSTLVSGMTYTPKASSNFNNFKTKMNAYLYNGSYPESWKDKGAVFDLDFILLDGQDQNTQRPLWDDPGKLAYDVTYAAVYGALVSASLGIAAILSPKAIRKIAEEAANAAKNAAPSPLDNKFFLHDGNFRLAHGYLDAIGLTFFKDRVDKDVSTQTLPIVCIHYWINYPNMDPRYNTGGDSFSTLLNEKDLFDTLDKCHLLLVGHIHEHYDDPNDPKTIHLDTFQKAEGQKTLAYYNRAGATFCDPIWWNSPKGADMMKDRRRWVELSINLNTKDISACSIDVDGIRTPHPTPPWF